MKSLLLSIFLFARLTQLALGTGNSQLPPPQHAQPDALQPLQHHAWVREWTTAQQEAAGDNPDIWIGPGIRADRRQQQVTFWAEATGLPPDTPVEFLLIDESSGHDYEAIAISFTQPSDVYQALTFLGLPPGEPFQPQALRFFPKGERIRVIFRWQDEEQGHIEQDAESLIRDLHTGTSLPSLGFTFVGSQWIEENGDRIFAADQLGPRALISLYNEPTTLLDRPRVAGQQRVYGFLQAYPDRQPRHGALLEILLRPEYPDGHRRVADVQLRVGLDEDTDTPTIQLTDKQDTPLHPDASLVAAMAAFEQLIDQGQTPYVRVESDPAVPLIELRDLYRWLRSFQDNDLLYIEPPKGNELFYRAFLPNETHRDRAQRPSQALELRLPRKDSDEPAKVVNIEDQRRRIDDEFDPTIASHPVSNPDDLPALLADINHRLPVLLVFAPAQMPLGELMIWLDPVRETHPTIHLFLE